MINVLFNRYTFLSVVFVLLALWAITEIAVWHSDENVERETKLLRFTYTLSNTTSDVIEHTAFQAFLPIADTATQKLERVRSKTPHYIVDHDGLMPSIIFSLSNIPPYGRRVITLTLDLSVVPRAESALESIDSALYLKSEKYIESNHSLLRELSKSLRENLDQLVDGDDERGYVYVAYEWVSNHIKNINYIAMDKGALYAVNHRRGDCTEHMYTFVALARAQGIPARGVSGFVISGRAKRVNSSDYHNWAEFYNGERWVLVDPQRRVFDANTEDYIAHRYYGGASDVSGNDVAVSESVGSGVKSANRFLIFDPRIKISL